MRREESFIINVEKGVYIGDLCYALTDEVYHDVWGAADYEDGAYNSGNLEFAVVDTQYGDGCYMGSDGFDYPVDAGIIGICDSQLVSKNIEGLGRIIPISGMVKISRDEQGTIQISFGNGRYEDIYIYTGDEYPEDEDEDVFFYDEEEDDNEDFEN